MSSVCVCACVSVHACVCVINIVCAAEPEIKVYQPSNKDNFCLGIQIRQLVL